MFRKCQKFGFVAGRSHGAHGYMGGVCDEEDCGEQLDHGVLVSWWGSVLGSFSGQHLHF